MEQKDSVHKEPFVFTSAHAYNWSMAGLMFVVTIAVGVWVINQGLTLYYHEQYLKGPCQLCVDLNPDVGTCWNMNKVLTSREFNFTQQDYYDSLNNKIASMQEITNGNTNSS